jgi:hypothetical protein
LFAIAFIGRDGEGIKVDVDWQTEAVRQLSEAYSTFQSPLTVNMNSATRLEKVCSHRPSFYNNTVSFLDSGRNMKLDLWTDLGPVRRRLLSMMGSVIMGQNFVLLRI